MNNPAGAYFFSFETVYWIDIFILEVYVQAIIQSLALCCKERGMILYGCNIIPGYRYI